MLTLSSLRPVLVTAFALAALMAALPTVAQAQAPANDHYLDASFTNSIGTTLPVGVTFSDRVNTAEATVQTDVFDPGRGGGGPAEDTTCPNDDGSTSIFGKTVWYLVSPTSPAICS